MIRLVYILLIPVLTTWTGFSQEHILNIYIREGLENNLSLKMKRDDYHQSLQSLREAKGLFFPDVSLNARYSVAEGGRMIEFPVGDLLNPVYSTLNQLTMSNSFMDIENQEFSFLRPKEHETKIRIIQPIISSDIYFNRKIKENLTETGKADIEVYSRSLVAEIKTAYYNHLKAKQIQNILFNTKDLLNENIRVNQSLYDNSKVTKDVVFRSEAELSKLLQQLAESEKAVKTTEAYFNFLLNRDLLLPVEKEETESVGTVSYQEQVIANALNVREELKMLDAYRDAAVNSLHLARAGHFPELAAVMDYGFQGTQYSFTREDDFLLASLVLRWELFKGFTNRSRKSHARIGLEKIERQREEAEKTIQLEVINACYSLLAAEKKIPAAESESRATEQTFRLVNRKYLQGQASLIEFMDARNSMTNAETGLAIARYDYLISYAEYERVAGLYKFGD